MVPLAVLVLSFAVSGCYVHRPYDPYYSNNDYKYKHKHHHDRDRDRDHDRDHDHDRDYGYHNRY